jgi:hypothetical protein
MGDNSMTVRVENVMRSSGTKPFDLVAKAMAREALRRRWGGFWERSGGAAAT